MTRTALLCSALLLGAGMVAAVERDRSTDKDVAAGRAAFITSGCAQCHGVSADPDLPTHDRRGPVLRELSRLPATEISARITARSPSGSRWMTAAESGMSRATGCTTLRDIRHIAVYLQAAAR